MVVPAKMLLGEVVLVAVVVAAVAAPVEPELALLAVAAFASAEAHAAAVASGPVSRSSSSRCLRYRSWVPQSSRHRRSQGRCGRHQGRCGQHQCRMKGQCREEQQQFFPDWQRPGL